MNIDFGCVMLCKPVPRATTVTSRELDKRRWTNILTRVQFGETAVRCRLDIIPCSHNQSRPTQEAMPTGFVHGVSVVGPIPSKITSIVVRGIRNTVSISQMFPWPLSGKLCTDGSILKICFIRFHISTDE